MDVKVYLNYQEGFSVIIEDVDSVQDAHRIALEAAEQYASTDMSDVYENRDKFRLDGRDPWTDTVDRDVIVADSEVLK